MKQYIKFLFAFLFIPNLYGMQFGEVKKPEEVSTQFVDVVKQALGVEVETQEQAEEFVSEAFNTFKKEDVKGCNIVFWKGDIYLNGLLNVTHFFDDTEINGKKYRAIQLCEILGCPVEEMEAMQELPKIFSRLEPALRYFPIKSFWNEAKLQKEDSEIDKILQEYSKKYPNYQYSLTREAYYIEILHSWGIDTVSSTTHLDATTQEPDADEAEQTPDKEAAIPDQNADTTSPAQDTEATAADAETIALPSEVDELFEFQSKAIDVIRSKMNEFLKKFGDYVCSFDKDDGERFAEGLQQLEKFRDLRSYVSEAEKLCSTYNRYTHTEYMIRYLQRHDEHPTEPLYALSFYDACKNCERMLAKTTSVKTEHFNTVIVSGSKYSSSRERERKPYLVNKSFLQIQLELK